MNELHTEPQLPAGAVVVGYEETVIASRALTWAADLADAESRPLVVVHATGSLGTPARLGSTPLTRPPSRH